jgi:type I restriction enzyme S subunit
MKSNYKPLGKYIQPTDERNTTLENLPLMGLSVSKEFFPTIANLVGTDMKTYKIVYRNQFTYISDTSRRGDKIAIALNDKFDKMLVSQAYTPFEVKDSNELEPEYLMMWFRRPEFDRYARFKSHGSAREIFDWEEMCNVMLPIPNIYKQREIVKEYKIIQNRIALNQQLIQKLEETAQAIYREWFVEFEFPDEDGKPYKSNGGEMVWNEELRKEIPKGWEVAPLGNYCTKITKGTTPEDMYVNETEDAIIKYIKGESLKDGHMFDIDKISFIDLKAHNELNRSKLEEFDICYSIAGTLDKFAIVDKEILPANTNQAIAIIRVDQSKINRFFIIGLFLSNWQMEFYRFNIQQAVQANLSLETISALPIIIPDTNTLELISKYSEGIYIQKLNLDKQNRRLMELKQLLLSRLATVEG